MEDASTLENILNEIRAIGKLLQKPAEKESEFLSMEEVCVILKKSECTIRRYVKNGTLNSHVIGRTNYFRKTELFEKFNINNRF